MKEARQSLVRYMNFFDASNGLIDSSRYLMGRIAEGLGLRETAEQFYSAVAQAKIESGFTSHDLSQIRIKVMGQAQ